MSSFFIDGVSHEVGVIECPACDGGAILGPCTLCDYGLVHAQLIGRDDYCDSIVEKCDKCEVI